MLIIPPNLHIQSLSRLSLHDANVRFAWLMSLRMNDVGIVLSLSEGKVLFATPSVQQTLGVSSKQLLQDLHPFTERIHPQDLRKFQSVSLVIHGLGLMFNFKNNHVEICMILSWLTDHDWGYRWPNNNSFSANSSCRHQKWWWWHRDSEQYVGKNAIPEFGCEGLTPVRAKESRRSCSGHERHKRNVEWWTWFTA